MSDQTHLAPSCDCIIREPLSEQQPAWSEAEIKKSEDVVPSRQRTRKDDVAWFLDRMEGERI
jgi:hypothetical protein